MRFKKVLFFVIVLFSTYNAIYSQDTGPPFPCIDPNDPVCGGQPGLPIDGGISFLLIAGAAYGIYGSRKNKRIK